MEQLPSLNSKLTISDTVVGGVSSLDGCDVYLASSSKRLRL